MTTHSETLALLKEAQKIIRAHGRAEHKDFLSRVGGHLHKASATPPIADGGEPVAKGDYKMEVFQSTVLGVGPWCLQFPDGEIIHSRKKDRIDAIHRLFTRPT